MNPKTNASSPHGIPTASHAEGGDFRQTVRGLAERLGVKVAFLCETTGPRNDQARTLALSVDGDFLENLQYELEGTPCALVHEKGVAYTAGHAAEMYPKDTVLEDWSIESYMGVACRSEDGSVLGHIGVMDDEPLANPAAVETELRSVASMLGPHLQVHRAG